MKDPTLLASSLVVNDLQSFFSNLFNLHKQGQYFLTEHINNQNNKELVKLLKTKQVN